MGRVIYTKGPAHIESADKPKVAEHQTLLSPQAWHSKIVAIVFLLTYKTALYQI